MIKIKRIFLPKSFLKIIVLAVFAALLACVYFISYAADGSGTNAVSPSLVNAGSTGNSLMFNFTAAEIMNTGELAVSIPYPWSAPQGVVGVAGYTIATSTNGVIANVEDNADGVYNWSSGTACLNGLSSTSTVKQEGGASILCSNGNQTSGNKWHKNITPENWESFTKIAFWIYSSGNLGNANLKFAYDNDANLASPIEELSFGQTISANTWTYVIIAFGPTSRASVSSFGFVIRDNIGLDNRLIYIDDILIGPGSPVFSGRVVSARILQLLGGQTVSIGYGNGGGASGAEAPSAGEISVFTTQSRSSDFGVLSNIGFSPVVTVNNPVPVITEISPSSIGAGGASFVLVVNGSGFNPNSIVKWNNSDRSAVYVSSNQLTVVITALDIASVGTANVTVFNPAPGGGTSEPRVFSITFAADISSPTIAEFSIPSASNSLTIPITNFSAADNVGVAGYLLTETSSTPSAGAAGWAAIAPASHVFSSDGSKTLYAWAKDAAGNVSNSLSGSVTITIPGPVGGTQSVSSVTTVAGGMSQSSAFFSGQAYPGITILILRKLVSSPEYEGASISRTVINDDGTFEATLEYFQQADWLFALQAKDKDGRNARLLAFSQFIKGGSIFKIENIFIPPTIDLGNAVIAKGKNLQVFGYAAPNSKVEAFVGDKKMGEAVSGGDGKYSFLAGVDSLPAGNYFVKTRYVLSADKLSDFSDSKAFLISPLVYPKADFNNDGRVTVADWSVFLYRWGQLDQKLRKTIDLNADEKIDISDFSVFLQAMK